VCPPEARGGGGARPVCGVRMDCRKVRPLRAADPVMHGVAGHFCHEGGRFCRKVWPSVNA